MPQTESEGNWIARPTPEAAGMEGNSAKWSKIEQRYRERRQGRKPGWTDDYADTEQQMRDVLARNRLDPGGKLLELGCGAGNRTLVAARMGFDAFGVDLSREAIAWASAKAVDEGIQADFRVGDIVSLADYAPGSFDVVFDGGVLYMIAGTEARAACFRNIARVLRPGGLLHATAHWVDSNFNQRHELGPGSWYDPLGRFTTIAGEPAYYFSTEDEFRGDIEGAGLAVLRMEKVAKDEPEHPFQAGSMWIDARKPDADGV